MTVACFIPVAARMFQADVVRAPVGMFGLL